MRKDTVKIRRGKRTDFPAFAKLTQTTTPPQETNKTQVRHWRRLAADLDHDCYVAEQDGTIHGILLLSYIRTLRTPGWEAIVDVAVSSTAAHGISRALLDFAKARARKRGCRQLFTCAREEREEEQQPWLREAGFSQVGLTVACTTV
jgi:N-acetylglutamate synthase-like GNAT family acetyltransferase